MTAPVSGTSVSGTSVPGTSVQDLWPDAAHGFPADRLDAFLLWAADRGASDIAFQTGSPAFVEIDGNLRRATAAPLDGVAMGRLCERLYDATGEGILRSGRAIDCSHSVRLARGLSRRFRCNLAPVQGPAGFAVKVPGAEPNAYTEGRDEEVDAAIAEAGLLLPAEPLWWDVVDLLFGVGAIEAAARAQRYAVPLLTDLLASVREPAVQGLVGDARYGTGGETVTQAFIRILTALSGDWPVMFAPTAFDVGGARLAAVDLAEVAPQGSAEADRQSAAFYLLARHALTRQWWVGEDALGAIPEPYRGWHAARLRDIRESPKRLCYDEFHRTAGAPAVRAQVERDVREARKLRVRLALASQRLEDFGGALAELANRYWILGAGGKAKEAGTLAATFALSDTLADAVRYRLTGPGRDGAPALLIAGGQGGRFEQLLVNTPGPVELWALTTSPADTALRRRLYALLPPARARAALARAFPEGTARGEIERELARTDASETGRAASEEAVLDRLAAEVARASADHRSDPPRPVPDGPAQPHLKPKGGTECCT